MAAASATPRLSSTVSSHVGRAAARRSGATRKARAPLTSPAETAAARAAFAAAGRCLSPRARAAARTLSRKISAAAADLAADAAGSDATRTMAAEVVRAVAPGPAPAPVPGAPPASCRVVQHIGSDVGTQTLAAINSTLDHANAAAEAKAPPDGATWQPTPLELPRVDMTGVRGVADGNEQDAQAVAAAAKVVGEAARGIGFFILVNTGIDEELFTDSLRLTREIHSDSNVRFPVAFAPPESDIGLQRKGASSAARAMNRIDTGEPKVDHIQSFMVGPADEERCKRMARHSMTGVWPEGTEAARTFREKSIEFMRELEALSMDARALLALSAGLDRRTFITPVEENAGMFRYNFYPPVDEADDPCAGKSGFAHLGGHTDFGSCTLLIADRPGLQIVKDGEWCAPPLVKGGVYVNCGDLMRMWSNDAFTSAVHRVRMPTGSHDGRASIAFFSSDYINRSPEYKEPLIVPVPELLVEGATSKYKPEKWSEIFLRRIRLVQKKASGAAR